jgi:acyl dehydratase
MKPGDKLPPFEKTFTAVDLFAYGAATWDWHRMHYDGEYARSKGFPGPVIDGQMYGAVFASLAMKGAGPRAFVTKMSLRMKSMAFAGDTLRAEGTVKSAEAGLVVLEQRLMSGDRVIAECTTSLSLR